MTKESCSKKKKEQNTFSGELVCDLDTPLPKRNLFDYSVKQSLISNGPWCTESSVYKFNASI